MSRDFAQLHSQRQREERERWRPSREQFSDLDRLKERAQASEWKPGRDYFTGPPR